MLATTTADYASLTALRMAGAAIVARMSEAISGTFIIVPRISLRSCGLRLTTPMNDVLPYRTMAYNNAWANHRLLTACARLSPDEFTAKRTGFFPSLRATLNHILIIDHFYVDAMEGGTLGPAAWADPGALRNGRRAEGSPGRGRPALAQDRRSARRRRIAAHRLRASRHLHPARADGPLAPASVPARRASSRAGPRHALRHVGEPASTRRIFLGR